MDLSSKQASGVFPCTRASRTNRIWDQLSYQEKNHQLYIRQKEMLALFLQKRAISQEQYEKSLHDLTEKLGNKEE